MKIIHLPLIALGVGLLLIVLSWVWPRTIGSGVWSDQQAREWSEASAEMHSLVHDHGHGGGDDHRRAGAGTEASTHEQDSPKLKAARERFSRADAGLQQARSLRSGVAGALKWTGILFLAVGTVGYWIIQRSRAD